MSRPLRSTPITGASPLLRAGPPADPATVLNASSCRCWRAPSRPGEAGHGISTCLPAFHAKAADRARAAFMPGTAWPVNGLPPGSSRGYWVAPVLMPFPGLDTSSAVRSRSPSRSLPDPSTGAFSSSLTTTVFSQRSMRWLDASPRRATPEGQQSSIFRTAPRINRLLPHPTSSRSRHTPVPQRALMDPQVTSDLGDRLPGLQNDPDRPLPELLVVLPSYLWHGYSS
jgi:hypothetical protein